MAENIETRISSEQAKDAIYKAHLSKDAIEKIVGLEASASEIDGLIENLYSNELRSLKVLDINDLYTFSKDGFYKELVFPNPYPDEINQPVHTSIAKCDSLFNGFKYWIAFTPYPDYDSAFENPSVIATNNFEVFHEPSSNPLVPAPRVGYNADTHIVFNDDYTILYLLFRERGNGINNLKVMHTEDGVTWTSPITILTGTSANKKDFASPSCWLSDGKWNIIYHNLDADTPKPMYKIISDTSDIYGTYSTPVQVVIPLSPNGANLGWWHSFIAKVSDTQLIGIVQDGLSLASPGNLYFIQSFDNGLTFDLCNRKITCQDRFYRSTFFRELDSLIVFPSKFSGKVLMFKAELGFSLKDNIFRNSRDMYLQNTSYTFSNILCLDSFTRANSSVIGNTDNGLSYTTTGSGFEIKGSKAYPLSSGAKAIINTGTSNYTIQSKINMTQGIEQWLIVRYIDANKFIRVGVTTGGVLAAALSLQEVKAGAAISIFSEGRIKNNSVLAVECRGKYITVLVDNQIVFSYITSHDSLSATKVGLQGSVGATSSYEDLIVTK